MAETKRLQRPSMGITALLDGAFREPSSAEQDHGADAVKSGDRHRGKPNSIGLRIGRLIVVALSVLFDGGMPALAAEELDFGTISDSPSNTTVS